MFLLVLWLQTLALAIYSSIPRKSFENILDIKSKLKLSGSQILWVHGHTGQDGLIYLAGCPSERAMVLAQIQKKGFVEVLRKAGLRGVYHGGMATLCRDISFNQSLFVLRAIIMRAYEQRNGKEPSPFAKIWWGLPASITASVVACPFDVVKTRVQGKELDKIGMYSNI